MQADDVLHFWFDELDNKARFAKDDAWLLQRAERAGCPVVAITVDLPAGRNPVTQTRFQRQDARDCTSCHGRFAGCCG